MIDTPTHRMVNGKRVELTPAEIAEIGGEWAAIVPLTASEQRKQAAIAVIQDDDSPIAIALRAQIEALRSELDELRAKAKLPPKSKADRDAAAIEKIK